MPAQVLLVSRRSIAPEWGGTFQKRFGTKLLEAYGMTEVNIPTYMPYDEGLRPNSGGRVMDERFEMRVLNSETTEPLPPNTVGEIVVRSQAPWCFMGGYNAMPEKTVEA